MSQPHASRVSHFFNVPSSQNGCLASPAAAAPHIQSEPASWPESGLQVKPIPITANASRQGPNLQQTKTQLHSESESESQEHYSTITEPRSMLVDRAEILIKLKLHIKEKYKTSRAAAAAWKCTPAFVSSVHKRLRPPNKAMLDALGYVRTEVYSPIPPNFSPSSNSSNSSNGLQGAADNVWPAIGDSS